MDCSPPGSSIHGMFQARVLEWVAISFSRGSSRPTDRTGSPALQADVLPSKPPGTKVVYIIRNGTKQHHVPTDEDDVPALPQRRTRFPQISCWVTHITEIVLKFPMRTRPSALFSTATGPCFCHSSYLPPHLLFFTALTSFMIFPSFTHTASPALLPQLPPSPKSVNITEAEIHSVHLWTLRA